MWGGAVLGPGGRGLWNKVMLDAPYVQMMSTNDTNFGPHLYRPIFTMHLSERGIWMIKHQFKRFKPYPCKLHLQPLHFLMSHSDSSSLSAPSLTPQRLLTFHSIPANMIDGRCGADNSMHDMSAVMSRDLFRLHLKSQTIAHFYWWLVHMPSCWYFIMT